MKHESWWVFLPNYGDELVEPTTMEKGRLSALKTLPRNVEGATAWGLKKEFGLSKIEEIQQVMRRYYPVTSVPDLLFYG
jgi:hypothetical protein